jgi:hypothetical protein
MTNAVLIALALVAMQSAEAVLTRQHFSEKYAEHMEASPTLRKHIQS